MKSAKYTSALLGLMSPELKARLSIVADREKISLGDLIVKILREGANTSSFLVAAGMSSTFLDGRC